MRAHAVYSARGAFARSRSMPGDVAKRRVPGQFCGSYEARECHRGLGHRRVACHSLRCWPRQDDQLAQSKLVGEPLAALDQGLGQW
jgi:hypothetical protein